MNNINNNKKDLSPEQRKELLSELKARFENIRNLGGVLYCDFRYNTVFVYHNGAESYYAARAFRGSLRI